MDMRLVTLLALVFALFSPAGALSQDCPPEQPPLLNFNGGGTVACPCFIPGEEAGVVFDLPESTFPIQILRVGITWGSQFGGAPQSLEQAIKIYEGGLPNPGAPVAEVLGPLMNDGFINEFDVAATIGEVLVNSGPFAVTLEFLNSNAGDFFAPSVVHDGNGCQLGKNIIKTIPGGWQDACPLGVTGDWVMYVVYRGACSATATEEFAVSSASTLLGASPNPFSGNTLVEFQLEQDGSIDLSVFDVRGRLVSRLDSTMYPAGRHGIIWDGRSNDGSRLPTGKYFLRLDAGGVVTTQKVVVLR